MSYEMIYVWSILLRLYHWSLVLSICVLMATGFYINSPWTNTTLEGVGSFPMATMRYYHFLAAYLFTAALLTRLFLYLFGNRQEQIMDILPLTPGNLRSLPTTLCYYSYLSDKHDERLGHNALAGPIYLLTIAAASFQILSGFYLLYPESALWQRWAGILFGSQQQGRFLHHLLMWYFILFAFTHIYMVIWNDITSSEGLISSIFTGNKFKQKNMR